MFFYDRFASQILENNRDPLTPAEIARLRKFYAQAQAFTGDAGPIPAVSQFTSGGAVLMGKRPKTKLDGSFLGLATYIEGNEVNPNINITNSVVVGSWLRGNGAIRSSRIIKSGVRDYQLDHVELTNSGVYGVQGYNLDFWNSLGGFMGQNKIAAVKTPTLANGSTRNSWIVAQAAILATGSKPFQIEDSFLNTRLGIWAGEGLKLKNVEMTGSWDFYRSADKAAQEEPGARLLAVNFGKNVTMENLTVGLDYFWDHPLTTDTGPYAITVLPNTEIRNGKILITKFLKGSVPGPNAPPDVYSHSFRPSFSLVIGQEGRAFRKDLGGKKAEARNEGGGLFQAIEKYFP
ncbi:MAG: hypothetical protein ACXVBL_19190 [Bdellovibrionota bacterium]